VTQDEQGSGGDFRKLFFTCVALALKYRWLVLAICALALAIGFIQAFTATPLYQATVTIQIDRQAPKVVKFDVPQDEVAEGGDRFYQTQYDLLKSRSLAERVAKDLNLAGASDLLNPPSTSAWANLKGKIFSSANIASEDKGNFGQKRAVAASIVQGGISVAP